MAEEGKAGAGRITFDILMVYDSDCQKARGTVENLIGILVNFVKIGADVEKRSPEVRQISGRILHSSKACRKLEEAMQKATYLFLVLTEGFCDSRRDRLVDEVVMETLASDEKKFSLIIVQTLTKREMQSLNYKVPFGLKSIPPLDVSKLVRGKKLYDVHVNELTQKDLRTEILDKVRTMLQRKEPDRESRERQLQQRREYETKLKEVQGQRHRLLSEHEHVTNKPRHATRAGAEDQPSYPQDSLQDSVVSYGTQESSLDSNLHDKSGIAAEDGTASDTETRESNLGLICSVNEDETSRLESELQLLPEEVVFDDRPRSGAMPETAYLRPRESGASAYGGPWRPEETVFRINLRPDALESPDISSASESGSSATGDKTGSGLISGMFSFDAKYNILPDEMRTLSSLGSFASSAWSALSGRKSSNKNQ